MKNTLDMFGGVAIDLDGTLIDSAPDLASAANNLLRTIGAKTLPVTQIVNMIGDGIDALVDRVLSASLGSSPSTATFAKHRTTFVELYRARIFNESRVYVGVTAGLDKVAARGIPIACITNKRSDLTAPLLAASGLDAYFSAVICADDPAQRKPAPAMLETLAQRWHIRPEQILMVGDSRLDVACARAAGCPVAAVDYGYEARNRLRSAGPDWIIGSLNCIDTLALNEDNGPAHDRASQGVAN